MITKPDGNLRWVTFFGLGHMRPFPGTWGSLPPVVLAMLLLLILPDGAYASVMRLVMLLVVAIFTLACVLLGDKAEARFGRKDPSQVVADEVAGMALCLALMPVVDPGWGRFGTLILAFVFFRATDIVKPWPAYALQARPGGWGVVLDDLAAGVQAAVLLWFAFIVANI
ncbi:MAG: phosphatidylglycerophosphatase A [Phycisphaerales bacterium JB060]